VSEYKPFQIELHGQSVELTDAEAKAILKSLHQQSSERRRAEEDQARAAGQVWYAVYWRYGAREEEECFSLVEAASYLDGCEGYGSLSSDSIRCPDGTVYTRDDRAYGEWSDLPALKVAS
jgi:hypothetical protein